MATPSTEQWVPKAKAAEMLGVSTREIERKAAAGRIRTQKVRLPGDKNDKAVYAVGDITTVKDQREAAALQLTVGPGQAAPHALPSVVAALTAVLQQTAPPRVERAWLTLDEAATYSGLPASEIARLIRERQVYAMGRGHVTWRIQRESLDEWGRMVHLPLKRAII